jgi:hypothetical protein
MLDPLYSALSEQEKASVHWRLITGSSIPAGSVLADMTVRGSRKTFGWPDSSRAPTESSSGGSLSTNVSSWLFNSASSNASSSEVNFSADDVLDTLTVFGAIAGILFIAAAALAGILLITAAVVAFCDEIFIACIGTLAAAIIYKIESVSPTDELDNIKYLLFVIFGSVIVVTALCEYVVFSSLPFGTVVAYTWALLNSWPLSAHPGFIAIGTLGILASLAAFFSAKNSSGLISRTLAPLIVTVLMIGGAALALAL